MASPPTTEASEIRRRGRQRLIGAIALVAILGAKNKVIIFLNWVWNYLTYDQSLRLVIKPWTEGPLK